LHALKKLISFLIRFVPRKYLQLLSGVGLQLAQWYLKGKGSYCEICNHEYRHFLPYGRLRARSNALCPNCLSLERHRLIERYLRTQTTFYQNQLSVLHIAPEKCFVKHFRKQHALGYITADLESPWADVKMDILKMPFENNFFDVVFCNHVLEHVDDDLQAMREIHRVLKPGGWAILQVPFFAPIPNETFEDIQLTDLREREKIFGQSDHIRRYGLDYPNRIERSGLKVIEEKFAFSLSIEDCRRYGLVPETIFVGVKS